MKTRPALAAFLIASVIVGCRTAPIHNPTDVRLTTPPNATEQDVGHAIRRAAANLGWTVQDTAPNEVVATLRARAHLAEVVITWTANSYSIRYRNSHNLLAEGDTIHRRYNTWVQNLEAQIRAQALIAGS